MSNSSATVAESLEALLTSLASSVIETQEALNNQPSIDALGRSLPSYHLPYLDFEVQVDMESVATESGGQFLRILPTKTNKNTTNISSKISGRFVSIPPGEGLPRALLSLSSEKLADNRYQINILASNTAGEVLIGHRIELNINMEASVLLSQAHGVSLADKGADTTLAAAILTTDNQGAASTELLVDVGLANNTHLVLTAELQNQTANISIALDGHL